MLQFIRRRLHRRRSAYCRPTRRRRATAVNFRRIPQERFRSTGIGCRSRHSPRRTGGMARLVLGRLDDRSISVHLRRQSDMCPRVCRSRDAAGPCLPVRRLTSTPATLRRQTVSVSVPDRRTDTSSRERFRLGAAPIAVQAVIRGRYLSTSCLAVVTTRG